MRAVYVAVRDEHWRTVPGTISNLEIRDLHDSFTISYDCVHQESGIDFRWKAEVTGNIDGTIVWRMNGQALSSFQKNRIGFCVLHPLAEFIGRSCQIKHTNGSIEHSCFPVVVAPHQPFVDMAAMSFRVNQDLEVQLLFSGDVFETEDQRNWSDASFKTYSTPLALPYPVWLREGTTVSQALTLVLQGPLPSFKEEPRRDAEVTLTLHPDVRTKLPRIGFKFAGSKYRLSDVGVHRFNDLDADHLSADLHPGNLASEEAFWDAVEEANRLSLPLEVVLHADTELPALTRVLREIAARKVHIISWLSDVAMESPDRIAERRKLESIAPVVFGAAGNFAELNRRRPSVPPVAGVWFSLNPQVHATDDTTLIENLGALPSVLSSIRAWNGMGAITVSPVTLKPPVNIGLERNPIAESDDGFANNVDQRQCSLLGAGWTLGTLKHLAEGGVASVTFYETAGYRGVMETESGAPLSRFRSVPNAVFPMYHVFSDVAAYKHGEVVYSKSSDPLRVESLAMIQASTLRVLVANLCAKDMKVHLKLAASVGDAALLAIDESNVELCMIQPEVRRFLSPQQLIVDEGSLHFDLKPYAIARIDAAISTLSSESHAIAAGGHL